MFWAKAFNQNLTQLHVMKNRLKMSFKIKKVKIWT